MAQQLWPEQLHLGQVMLCCAVLPLDRATAFLGVRVLQAIIPDQNMEPKPALTGPHNKQRSVAFHRQTQCRNPAATSLPWSACIKGRKTLFLPAPSLSLLHGCSCVNFASALSSILSETQSEFDVAQVHGRVNKAAQLLSA
jgi:hypothetical protein